MSWTDDRVKLLERLWGEGKTAAEIAKTLGGVTRNAVIGKAHRLRLAGRVATGQENSETQSVQKTVKLKSEAKSQRTKTAAKSLQSDIVSSIVNIETVEDTYCEGKGVKLVELREGLCRWPIGDPKEADFKFCGGKAQGGMIYCNHHCNIAYQVTTKGKLRIDELSKIDHDVIRKKA